MRISVTTALSFCSWHDVMVWIKTCRRCSTQTAGRAHWSQYAVLLGHFYARRSGRNDEAEKLLEEAAAKCDTTAWPFAIIKYLRGEIDEPKLLAAAIDTSKMTEARCYLALDLEQKGRRDEALTHFRWVKESGVPTFYEYYIAIAELDRLAEKAH